MLSSSKNRRFLPTPPPLEVRGVVSSEHRSIPVLALYGLFKLVNKPLARQLALLGLIPMPIVFMNALNEIAALVLVSGTGFLSVFDKSQLDALAMLFVRLHSQGIQVAAVFWGLWLFPFGLLIVRCGFIPKTLGVLVIVAGVGYVVGSSISLVLPQYSEPLGDIAGILQFGELPIILWLLIWGAKAPRARDQLSSAAG